MYRENETDSQMQVESDARAPGRGAKLTRRQVLAGAAGIAAAAVSGAAMAQESPPTETIDPTKVMGSPADQLGERSAFEELQRLAVGNRPQGPNVSFSPLGDLDGIITPSDLHYEIHHNGVPEIDPSTYKLLIHGMVERPMVFTLDDLKRYPRTSRTAFLECAGNSGFHSVQPGAGDTAQTVAGLTSCSEWFGVPLSLLFQEAGVSSKASWALFEAMDGAVMTRSWPTEKLWWGEAFLAYGQNGEALRPSQGYPVRLFVPGTEGNANVKWLRRIELSDQPWQTRMETARYSDIRCGEDGECEVSQFSFELDAKSVITWPSGGQTIPEPGIWQMRGIAWTGRGSIERVEISTDGGESWALAELELPVLPKAHTRFRFQWDWDGEEHTIMSRAIDSTGYVQPSREQLLERHGTKDTFYHANQMFRWKVNEDGTVSSGDV